jgi:hypothetical protein
VPGNCIFWNAANPGKLSLWQGSDNYGLNFWHSITLKGCKFGATKVNLQILVSFTFVPQIKPASFQPYIGLEDHFQISAARYLDTRGVLWFHTPNGGLRDKNIARKFKAMGLKPGVPDVLILETRHGYTGFAIELKCGKNDTTEFQDQWIMQLRKRGWKILVTWSLDEFIFEVDSYFATTENNVLNLPS